MSKSGTSKRVTSMSKKTCRAIIMQNLREWNTPRSLAIYLLMKYEDDASIARLTPINPTMFLSPKALAEFTAPTDLVRKSPILNTGINTRDAAIIRFHEAEQQCAATNRRIQLSRFPTGRLGANVHLMRKIIGDVLPEITRELLDGFIEQGGWGKGVTSSVKGRDLRFSTKLGSTQQSTLALYPVVKALQAEVLGMDGLITVQDYNTVSFVPKDTKTDRAIAVEPSLNAYLQRGAGKVIRRALRKLGVDLIHGQRRNAALARIGSIDGSYATIDLSMASDTMAIKAVQLLLPDTWLSLLGLLRTPYYRLGGETNRYEKWSSMGNGYTFELESLIFAAACAAVSKGKDFAVYGDDLIVPTESVEALAELLSYLGFTFNLDKSFSTGPFRESCGSDYFQGIDVRSFFIKEINPVLPYIWYNALAADRLLPPCPKTMGMLVRSVGKTACFAPFRSDHAFWVDPIAAHEPSTGIRFGYKHGVSGVYYYGVTFKSIEIPLNTGDSLAHVATHLRLVLADEPTERLQVKESFTEVGRWVRKRLFADNFDEQTWPRG